MFRMFPRFSHDFPIISHHFPMSFPYPGVSVRTNVFHFNAVLAAGLPWGTALALMMEMLLEQVAWLGNDGKLMGKYDEITGKWTNSMFFCRDICRRVGFIVGFRNEKWWLKQQTWWNNGDSLERLTTMLADLSVHNQTWPGNPRTSGNLNGKVVEVIGYFPANHAWLPEGNKWKQVFDVTWMGMWWDFTVPTILENRMICAILEDDHQSMNTQIICPCSGWTPEDRKWVSSPQW